MRRLITMGMALSLAVFLPACSGGDNGQGGKNGQSETASETARAGGQQQLKTQQDKFSYAVGMDIGHSLKPFQKKLKPKKVLSGLQDTLEGKKAQLTQKEKKQVIQAYVEKIQAQRAKKKKAEAAKNAKQSKKFLAKNAKKKGVKTTSDGLQYQVLKEGSGSQPGKNDVVTVKYKGKLPNGKVFDSSYKRGQPATFPVDNVIPGWSEALQLMHVGGKYRLVIPPKLAYGEQGAGGKIGPNQALIFNVHLVGIKKKSANKGNGAAGGSASQAQAASTGDGSQGGGAGQSGGASGAGNTGENASGAGGNTQ